MVAQAGRGWRLAPSLVQLFREVNTRAPRRSRASDGSIGDQSHAARASYHNPQGGVVDALDITHDPRNGMDVHRIAREIVARGDSRLDHVISNGQIWTRSRAREGWRRYTGANPHRTHAHFAVFRNGAGRNSMATWLGYRPQPPPPPPPAPKPQPQPQPVPQPDPEPEEDEDMALYVRRRSNGGIWRVAGNTATHLTGPSWEWDQRLALLAGKPISLHQVDEPEFRAIMANRLDTRTGRAVVL